MAIQPYATTSDLSGWLPDGTAMPDNATALLRSATIRMANACNRSPYDTPTSTDAGPLADATCAQAASWVALSMNPAAQGLDIAPVKQSKIFTGDVTYDTTGQAEARQTAAADLCPEACEILRAAGLLWQPVPAASGGRLPSWGLDDRHRPFLPRPEIDWP